MILASTFFMTACSLFGGDKDDIVFESNVQEKRIGILKSLGGMSVGEGTHILELENQSTMRLRSSIVDLDNEKYLAQRVEIRGPIAKTEDGKDLMEVKSIDLAEEEEQEETLEGVEKEYTNAQLGFRLVYTDSWEINEESDRIVFNAPKKSESEDEESEDMVIIERFPNPQKKSLESFLQLPSDNNSLITLGYTQTLVGTDQLEGLKKEANNRQEIDIWLTRGDDVYQLSFIGSENPEIANNRNTFFSMVTSFRFIGILEEEVTEESEEIVEEEEVAEEMEEEEVEKITEGYSFFESLPYKFTGQYPSSWYFNGSSGTGDTIHHYGFGDEPLDEGGQELISVDIVSGSLPSGSPVTFGQNSGVKVYENGKVAIYITRTGSTLYKIHGDTKYESKIIDMAYGLKSTDQ